MNPFPPEMIPEAELRAMYGWFGEPWKSAICYGPSGRLIEVLRKPVPVTEDCWSCETRIGASDSGHAIVDTGKLGQFRVRHIHRECSVRETLGGLNHMNKRCSCYGGTDDPPDGMTKRDEALAVWGRLFAMIERAA